MKGKQMSSNGEEAASLAMCLATWSVPSMVLKAVLELNILEIIKKHGPGSQLSAAQIVAQLPAATANPNAVVSVDRMLRLLASFSVLTCSIRDGPDGGIERMYGLGPACDYLTKNEDGVSFAAFALLMQDKVIMDACNNMKEAIIGGGVPFNQTHGMNIFEYISKDSRFREVFYNGMKHHSTIVTKKILEIYQGFSGISTLVDVGGATGDTISLIVSKYPSINGINFDLPHVIQNAPSYPGVEHIAGDMYVTVPNADAIFMKWTFHTASDEQCIKLLKNCHTALPNNGKVIVCEYIVPEVPETSYSANTAFIFDAIMFAVPGGKERTKRQYQALGKEAGFLSFQLICSACDTWIMEFMKDDPIRTD
ncbi:caffeic acid 3-O-methyltransferase-like [Silene latifolia]|uniref:caffeic acid 3-O-methyltransferase-like n=1 Tax=Silene latifolia TaxID=37657 RepID=UPI003D7838D1